MTDIETIVRNKLFSSKDEEYRKFHSNLCPGINNIIGVRVPILRNLLKELLTKYSFYELYNSIGTLYYEEIMLKGMLLGKYKGDFEKLLTYIKEYIPLIDNWAICDTFCSGLKITKKYKKEMRDFILKYKDSNKEFELRFMIVMILDYYIEKEYLFENFEIFEKIKNNSYYVEMAIAWALSICLIKYYDETISYLKRCNLSNFVYNKTISKACDSYRISEDNKNELRNMRR